MSCSNSNSVEDIRLGESDCGESEESAYVIDNIPVNPDRYRITVMFVADLRQSISPTSFTKHNVNINFFIFTHLSATPRWSDSSLETPWREDAEQLFMHRHTGPAPGIMVWGGIGYHYRTPLVRIAGTLNSQRYISEVVKPVVLPYL
ncbi:transposable element Tcb1 transposase [Trichonephila clavipes]|nr:transposable element Tcb1 transposase [Trichonephila clavipes]